MHLTLRFIIQEWKCNRPRRALTSALSATPTSTSPPSASAPGPSAAANWEFAWGPQDDNESIAAIHRALDLGVNWIDTAAIYGLGHSEEIVAQRLKSASRKPLVFTKCSMRWHADRTI